MDKDIEYLKKYYNGNIDEAIDKLKQGIPVQYIVGNVDFYGNRIEVNKNVLIPRFETEELIEKTLEMIDKNKTLDIIDLGTGSGCIAITLAKELKANIDAVDISKEALEVAKRNAKNNKVDINFILGDMLENISKKYDLIISNPPYISYDEEIMDIVKNNEPHLALFANNNGLEFYEKILAKCQNNLKPNSLIAFEIGYKQEQVITDLIKKYLPNSTYEIKKDMQGKVRFAFIKYHN